MNRHQVITGASNSGDHCFAVGSVESINFTVSVSTPPPLNTNCYSVCIRTQTLRMSELRNVCLYSAMASQISAIDLFKSREAFRDSG